MRTPSRRLIQWLWIDGSSMLPALPLAPGSLLRVVALLDEILLRPLPLRRDVREHVHPRNADGKRRDRSRDRPPAPTDEREHDEAGGEREQRRAREREEQRRPQITAPRRNEHARAPAQERRTEQQRDDEHVGARERPEERRHEPAQEMLRSPPLLKMKFSGKPPVPW